jgi:hypothetical protein
MIDEYIGRKVVIDLKTEYVCLGTLLRTDEHFLEIKNADLHDLRDTESTRENYVIAAVKTGIKRNRKKLLLFRSELVAVSLLDDIVDS